MPSVYVQMSKISNAAGRSDYISNKERQEEIVMHQSRMAYSWKEHSAFEKQHQKSSADNNEARELIIKLPNELDTDREKLKEICSCLAVSIIGPEKDYEYAVHWNKGKTNLHVHILFSERENQLNPEPKIYKKDIWQDRNTHKLAKAGAENAVLVHRKGEIQLDKEGNVKYQADIFKTKDIRFKSKGWLHDQHYVIQKVMEQNGFALDVYEHDSPYLAQKKLYKGASEDYLEKAREWNDAVKKYNEDVKEHIELDPSNEASFIEDKKTILSWTKEINSAEKKIMQHSIEIIKDIARKLRTEIEQIYEQIRKVLSKDASGNNGTTEQDQGAGRREPAIEELLRTVERQLEENSREIQRSNRQLAEIEPINRKHEERKRRAEEEKRIAEERERFAERERKETEQRAEGMQRIYRSAADEGPTL